MECVIEEKIKKIIDVDVDVSFVYNIFISTKEGQKWIMMLS